MKVFIDILDSLIHAIQLIARSVAFLLGIHLVIFLYFVRILSSEPAESNQRQRRVTVTTQISQNITTGGRVFTTHARPFSPARHLHLPALTPRPYERPLQTTSSGIYKHLIAHLSSLGLKIRDEMADLADQMEMRGGKSGEMITLFRKRGESELKAELLQKLPSEITNYILMTASDTIPTKICLLSKRYHRLVIPRLYKTVELCDPQIFHQFRLTIALHNPNLGKQIESLSVGSNVFDNYGYFPDAIAESAALGVGLEQILITASNLKHLYLDLFSLAALHDGTASRLQNGSLPISLSTEYAAPQYLSLSVFNKLKHVELSVFGLDKIAIEYLRQALPHIKTLTLRWVTRQSPGFEEEELIDEEDHSEEDNFDDPNEGDNFDAWSKGNKSYQRKDFDSFVEALESLRLNNPSTITTSLIESPRQPLEAITILAWPNVMRQLVHYYRNDKDVLLLESNQVASSYKDPEWNQSIGHQDEYCTKPHFDRLTRRRPTTVQLSSLPQLPVVVPLRLGVDPTYRLGPRRGPLESWSSQWR